MYSKIVNVVRECGNILLNADRNNLNTVTKKSKDDFVTTYDIKIQGKLQKELKALMPDVIFIGEEGDVNKITSLKSGKYFIVDPIDGTTNFVKDYHMSCISVAYIVDGEVEFAIVYNPYLNEMFTAIKDQGAYLNNNKINVSKNLIENGLVLFGTSPYDKDLSKKSFELAYNYLQKANDLRRNGSAALDLCYIACGRAELYFELAIRLWDYAAGYLIVKEAGGIVTNIEGKDLDFINVTSILASNGKCHDII